MLWKTQWSVGERMWTGAQAWPGMNLHGITQLLPHQLVDHLIMDLCSEGTEAKMQRPRTYSFYWTSSYLFFSSFHRWLWSTHSVSGPALIQGCATKSVWIMAREDGLHCLRMPLSGFLAFFFFLKPLCSNPMCWVCLFCKWDFSSEEPWDIQLVGHRAETCTLALILWAQCSFHDWYY